MAKTEQEALYLAIQAFLGKWRLVQIFISYMWLDSYSGCSCDLYDGLWYVTDLNIGLIHNNSLSCASNPEFSQP